MKKRPDVGTKMYFVQEHRYYTDARTGPLLEFCVCEGEVTGFFKKGFEEVRLVGLSPDGYRTPYFYKLSDIGSKLFYSAREAAERAKALTEKYESTWGWFGAPYIPLRRSWEADLN